MSTESPEALALADALRGQYELEREIGRGGMGIVYLARDLKLQRDVAIKTLPAHLAGDAAVRERFLREARTSAALSHPNIVPIHRADEIAGQVFFVMGFVDGDSLAQRIQASGRVPFGETVSQLRDVASALGYAHARSVVHRDVKAENILLERATGRAVVTDFGIARVSEAKPLTATGHVLGSVHYMSPEQVAGEGVDGRSDVYALGVVGFFALSGRFPFESDTASAVLLAHVTKPTPPLRLVAPDVPAGLAAIVDRCLAKDPGDRFQSCAELVSALEATRAEAELAERETARAGRDGAASTGPAAAALVSETEANAIWLRAAELQAMTGSSIPSPVTRLDDRRAPTSASSAYGLDQVRVAAREAGIGEEFVQRALIEHGIRDERSDSRRREVANVTAPQPAPAAGDVATKVVRLDVSPSNPVVGGSTRIAYEAVIDGEMPDRDFDLLLEIIRRRIGEWGQVSTVGHSFAWNVSKETRTMQVSVVPRGGRTTVYVEEQFGQMLGAVFGGIVGGGGGGLGAAAMGITMATLHNPVIGATLWGLVAANAYGTARFVFRRIYRNRDRQLRDLTERLVGQVVESIAASRPERLGGARERLLADGRSQSGERGKR